MMHRSDPVLQSLDAKAESGQDVAAEIAAREKLLLPLFSQVPLPPAPPYRENRIR